MPLETAPLYPVEATAAGLETFWLEGAAGKRFRAAFLAHPEARGSIIILPGRTECLEKYLEVVADFGARGLNLLLVEPRGQGLSDRLLADRSKGHMDSWDHAVSDLATAVDAFADRMPGKRLLMAHSMGGAIALEALLSGKVVVEGAAFSAPMWGIRLPPGGDLLIKGMIATGFGENIVPGGAAKVGPEPFEGNALTSDPIRHARQNALIVAHPELGLAGATAAWVGTALELLATFSPERLKTLTIPVLVGSGSLEALVDNDAHTRVAGQLPKGRQIVISGAKHELLMEADGLRDQFLSAVDGFVDSLLA